MPKGVTPPPFKEMDAGASKMFLGVVLGSLATKVFSGPSTQPSVESCTHAYYADAFNGVRQGNPAETFVSCMAAQNRELFKSIKAQYERPAPAEQNT
jgi:hypothetical protein